jgi:hypothetical protein
MNIIKVRPQVAAHKYIKVSLVAIALSISLPQTVMAQRESAEERMNRIYSQQAAGKKVITTNSNVPQNAPGNMISEKQIYWYCFKGQHKAIGTNKDVSLNIDNENDILSSYLKVVHNMELNRFDEFERRRILAKTKKEIEDGVATLDYNTEYAKSVLVASMGEYNFKTHKFRFELRNNISFLHQFAFLDFLSINLPAVISIIDIPVDEDEAERVVKYLRGKDVNRNVIAVKFIRVNPVVIVGKRGRRYITATESKTAFYLMKWEDGDWNYGDKIGECEWQSSDPYPHPELQ